MYRLKTGENLSIKKVFFFNLFCKAMQKAEEKIKHSPFFSSFLPATLEVIGTSGGKIR